MGQGRAQPAEVREAPQEKEQEVWPCRSSLNFPAKLLEDHIPCGGTRTSGRPLCRSGKNGPQTQQLKLTQTCRLQAPGLQRPRPRPRWAGLLSGSSERVHLPACPGAGRLSSRGCGTGPCFLLSCWRVILGFSGSQHPWPQPPPASESAAGRILAPQTSYLPSCRPSCFQPEKVLCFQGFLYDEDGSTQQI